MGGGDRVGVAAGCEHVGEQFVEVAAYVGDFAGRENADTFYIAVFVVGIDLFVCEGLGVLCVAGTEAQVAG